MKEQHTQLKAKCLSCDLHFVVCTEHPARQSKRSLHCPECGQHAGNFATWAQVVAGPIHRVVPGEARPTDDMATSGVIQLNVKDLIEPH